MKQPSRTLLWVIAVSLLIAFTLLAWRSWPRQPLRSLPSRFWRPPASRARLRTTLGSDTLSC